MLRPMEPLQPCQPKQPHDLESGVLIILKEGGGLPILNQNKRSMKDKGEINIPGQPKPTGKYFQGCLLYTSDAADE